MDITIHLPVINPIWLSFYAGGFTIAFFLWWILLERESYTGLTGLILIKAFGLALFWPLWLTFALSYGVCWHINDAIQAYRAKKK